jgi:hypothetical protein
MSTQGYYRNKSWPSLCQHVVSFSKNIFVLLRISYSPPCHLTCLRVLLSGDLKVMLAPFSASSFEIVCTLSLFMCLTLFFFRESWLLSCFWVLSFRKLQYDAFANISCWKKKTFHAMFDPECLCSKLAAPINVSLASSEAKEMTSILCLGIESGEVEICVVGL